MSTDTTILHLCVYCTGGYNAEPGAITLHRHDPKWPPEHVAVYQNGEQIHRCENGQTDTRKPELPLRTRREAQGQSLSHIARRINVDKAQLSKIERGLVTPTIDVLKRLADVLELEELGASLAPYVTRPR